ncbi:MAG: hypothetical protein H6710_21590 [Myxococcales bacterium]|nr:hypothetical protein [Myxococcales bacterium]MCB9701728.1 hypothetical protein [Myxococcales bacterium]
MIGRRALLVGGALGLALPACRRKGTVVPPGNLVAPDFTLTDSDGELVTLNGLTAHGPTVLVFYRGFW